MAFYAPSVLTVNTKKWSPLAASEEVFARHAQQGAWPRPAPY